MKKNSFKTLVGILFVIAMFASCASTPNSSSAKLTKTQSRAFWRIDGTDSQGNPSTVYIQGTFHLGDERIMPPSDEVLEAFQNADRIAAEISTQGYIDLATYQQVLAAPNKDGKIVTDYLTDEENAFLQMMFGENLPVVAALEPWQMTNAIAIGLYVNTGLSAEYGLDNYFITDAANNGRSWDGLDELQVQLDIITFGDYDTQIQMLKDTIKGLTDPKENKDANELTKNLYESYVADDMKKMEEYFEFSTAQEESSASFYKEYNNMVYKNRNIDWAKDITDYLNEGGTTFIFAGTGHWLGKDSVFSFLKEMKTIN